MGRLSTVLRQALVVAAGVLVGSASGADDPRQSYLDGLRAYERHNWQQAARLLRQAITRRPEEASRARLVGAMPEPYLPHAYLGLALYRVKLCGEAAEAFRATLAQQAVETVPGVAAEVKAAAAHCAALGAADQALAEAESGWELLEPVLKVAVASEPSASELSPRHHETLAALARGREALAEAKSGWQPAVAERARVLAVAAVDGFSRLGSELHGRRTTAQVGAARARLEQTIREALSLEQTDTEQGQARRALASLAAERSQAQTELRSEDLSALVAAAEQLGEAMASTRRSLEAPVPSLPGVEAPPVTAVTAPPAPKAPDLEELPTSLRTAMEAYFAADYVRAAELLAAFTAPAVSPDTGAAARVRLFVALFRAAARYALYLLSGEEDPSLREAAAADLKIARQQDPAFSPHPDFFSPRFVAFFRDHP